MRTETLGLIGILCSPFLAIQLNMFGIFEHASATSLAGVFGLIYMSGWFCSILGLYRLNAAGNKMGRIILLIQMTLLTIGNLWNLYSIIDPKCDSILFYVIDMIGWPVDNIFMLATGIAVLSAKQLKSWKRFAPLLVGMWFPITVVMTRIVLGSGEKELVITSLYSMLAWALLGLAVYVSAQERAVSEYRVAKVS